MNDLIKRSDALKELRLDHKDVIYIDKNECAKRIKAIPSADRPRGEWIVHSNDKIGECSECGSNFDNTVIDVPKWNFCPNCGARMKGAEL